MKSNAVVPRRWLLLTGLLCLGITCVPYLYAWALVAGTDRWFIGLIHYPDDAYVYMAWMRQAAEGRFFFENRFDLGPQRGLFINLLFWVLGLTARLTGLPLIAVFHLARLAFGALTLWLGYRLIRECLAGRGEEEDPRLGDLRCRAAFLLLCFSAGLGWLFPRRVPNSPVDAWQTEANTFLSLYQNPLFGCALALMLGIFLLMLRAEREDSWRPAWLAGLLALLLANIHSYDILIVWPVWAGTVVGSWVVGSWGRGATRRSVAGDWGGGSSASTSRARLGWRSLARLGILGAVPLPAVAYQAWLFLTEPTFQKRALVPTGPAPFHWYLLGLGLLIPLAALGAWHLLGSARNHQHQDSHELPLTLEHENAPRRPRGAFFRADTKARRHEGTNHQDTNYQPPRHQDTRTPGDRGTGGDDDRGCRTEDPTAPSPNDPTTPRPNHPITQRPHDPTTPRPNHPITQRPHDPTTPRPHHPITLLLSWALVQLALPYVPLAFNRKLAMGVHIPWAILAGAGLAYLALRMTGASGGSAGGARRAALLVLLGAALTTPTLCVWLGRAFADVNGNQSESLTRLLFLDTEREALRWLSHQERGSVLGLPPQLGGLSTYVPALTGQRVYAGHFGESPDFGAQVRAAHRFYAPEPWLSLAETARDREALLSRLRIRYVLYGPAERALRGGLDPGVLPSLRTGFRAGSGDAEVTVYIREE